MDPLQVYDKINLGRRIDPLWPDELWRSRGGQNYWKDWLPEEGMEGIVSKFKKVRAPISEVYPFLFADCA